MNEPKTNHIITHAEITQIRSLISKFLIHLETESLQYQLQFNHINDALTDLLNAKIIKRRLAGYKIADSVQEMLSVLEVPKKYTEAEGHYLITEIKLACAFFESYLQDETRLKCCRTLRQSV